MKKHLKSLLALLLLACLPLSAAARCAEGCGEARRGMDRSLNQKLLFTLLAAKLCDAAG